MKFLNMCFGVYFNKEHPLDPQNTPLQSLKSPEPKDLITSKLEQLAMQLGVPPRPAKNLITAPLWHHGTIAPRAPKINKDKMLVKTRVNLSFERRC